MGQVLITGQVRERLLLLLLLLGGPRAAGVGRRVRSGGGAVWVLAHSTEVEAIVCLVEVLVGRLLIQTSAIYCAEVELVRVH